MAPSNVTIRVLTNQDTDFYALLGPLLARREVHKSLGGPAWDDDDKTWIVALKAHQVAGFIALTRTGAVESLYTRPSHTNLRATLVKEAVAAAGDTPLHATVSRSRADAYQKAGFQLVSETVNFVKLHRPQETS